MLSINPKLRVSVGVAHQGEGLGLRARSSFDGWCYCSECRTCSVCLTVLPVS